MAVAGPVESTILREALTVSWTGVNTSEGAGNAYELPARRGLAASVQFVSSAWGGSTVLLEGSNDGVNYSTIKDGNDVAVSATANAVFELSTSLRYIRPSSGGGIADVVDVYFVGRG